LAGYAAYVAIGIPLVGAIGVALPQAFGLPDTHVAEPSSIGLVLVLFLVGRSGRIEAGPPDSASTGG